jgi:hypothetical protein
LLIGVIGQALTRRHVRAHLVDAPAVLRMVDDEIGRARQLRDGATFEQLRSVSWRRRLLQITVPVGCIVGYLLWIGNSASLPAVRQLMLPVSMKGWLLILPYALLVPLLLVRDQVQLWLLRRNAKGRETVAPAS